MKVSLCCQNKPVESRLFGRCKNRRQVARLKRLVDLQNAIENALSDAFDRIIAEIGPLEPFLDEIRNNLTANQEEFSYLLLNPLHKACFHHQPEFIDKLLKNGANPYRLDERGRSPVEVLLDFWEARYRHIGHVFREQTEDLAVDVEALIKQECEKIQQRGLECLKLLMSSYESLSVKFGYDEVSAMHICLELNLFPVLEYLVTQGADLNSRNREGNTPLILATRYFNMRSINTLLENGANVNARNNGGLTALHYSCRCLRRSTHAIDALIKYGADVNIQTNTGFTALHYAALYEEYSKVHKLLSYNADPDITTVNGQTVLYFLMDSRTGTTTAAAIAYNHVLCEMKEIRIRDNKDHLPLSLRNGDYPGLASRFDDFTSKPRPLKQLALVCVKRMLGKKRQNAWHLQKLRVPKLISDIILNSETYTDVLLQLGIRLQHFVPYVYRPEEDSRIPKLTDARYGLWLGVTNRSYY